jgi:hypothetical protein
LVDALTEINLGYPNIKAILDRGAQLGLELWYLAAGYLPHTLWNRLDGNEPTHGMKDYDLVYFDKDTS